MDLNAWRKLSYNSSTIFLSKKKWSPLHEFMEFCLLLAHFIHYNAPKWPVLKMDQLSSVQFSHSVVSDSLQHHESQHTRPPCPSLTPRVYSSSCPLSRWCHPAISSSVTPFSSCPQSLPASGNYQRVNSSHEVAKVQEFQLQHQSFQWTPRTDLL